jgi:hypothetical protein
MTITKAGTRRRDPCGINVAFDHFASDLERNRINSEIESDREGKRIICLLGLTTRQIRRILIILALVFFCPSAIWANIYVGSPPVVLSWAPNAEGDLQGYEIYFSDSYDGPYQIAHGGVIVGESWSDTSASYGDIRHYRLQAVDVSGNRSGFSAPSDAFIISDGDFDFDGFADVFEDTMGTDPLNPDSLPSATTLDLSPATALVYVGGFSQLSVLGTFDPPVGDTIDYNMTCVTQYHATTPGIVFIDICGRMRGLSEGTTSVWAEQTIDGQTIATSNIALITVLAKPSKAGVFINGSWLLDLDGDGAWGAGDIQFRAGVASDAPVVGDWNGDGTDILGVFRNGQWYIDTNESHAWDEGDMRFRAGVASDAPVVGDWNGNGTDTPGIFRDGQWYIDTNGNHAWDGDDIRCDFGAAGDAPVSGDWNGDGIDTIGVFRDGQWSLDLNGNGAWDAGDAVFDFGAAGDVPVVGDWNGDGIDTIGVFRDGEWRLDSNGDGVWNAGDTQFTFGPEDSKPVVGKW